MTAWHLPDPQTQPEFYSDVAFKRLLAFVIDTVLIVLICLAILPFTAFTGLFFFPALMAVVGFLYRVITIANGSATLGMRLAGIELRTARGDRFDPGHAVMHTLLYTMACAVPIFQVISVIMMATTQRGQGLGDTLLGTSALNRRMVRAA